jgi:hypothetical protein
MPHCYNFRAPSSSSLETSGSAKVPKLELKKETMFIVPELDMRSLTAAVDTDVSTDVNDLDSSDKNVLWMINYDRFNREFRDQVKICF